MASLPARKSLALKALFGQMPARLLDQLTLALSAEDSGPMYEVRRLVQAQGEERRLRTHVLEPVLPLFGRLWGQPSFPVHVLGRIWDSLQSGDRSLLTLAARLMDEPPPEGDPHMAADALCRVASGKVMEAVGALEALPDGCNRTLLADCLAMAPVVRPALPRLNEWINRPSDERRAALRVCYHHAVQIRGHGGPLFFEILTSHLERPWQVLTLISIVMDHPDERYIAGSEFASFGTRILDQARAQIELVKGFDPKAEPSKALTAARAVQVAHQSLQEMTIAVELSPHGAWGGQVAELRKSLIAVVESLLKKWPPLLAQALPMNKASVLTPPFRATPKLSEDLTEGAGTPIMAWLNFVDAIRQDSGTAGFGALRSKMLEGLDERLQSYVDDVLDLLRSGEAKPPQRAADFVGLAADLALARGDRSYAELVRRRLATVTDRHGAIV